ncbi:cytochrome c oxidase subunit 3 [Sphingomonas rubra]|uniref:Cytochrome bo(3) ubiquinol oxidase subunit 3 n=1 Tax=Sphingomonas rubra TaxID=634430 RepID=A0A1I5TTK4_9SPHN|nr:cytochrome c oxidase subunit 3 [Sphingomonas rubra]SFP86231.1 cytochrome o ubiquinol oxidase subunit 3 [Sphingomonas rubra]
MSEPELAHAGLNLGPSAELTRDGAENAIFGFWIFLMSDAVIFALLFATYGTMVAGTAGGPTPASEFKLLPAFVETLLLLTSSATFGRASIAMKYAEPRRTLFGWLGATLGLGLTFLALEANDYATMVAHGAVPSRSGFLSAFYALTGLHGLHVAVACFWLVVMVGQVLAYGLDARVKINLLRLGLFWHLLDIVWIAIFSVVYLQGAIR